MLFPEAQHLADFPVGKRSLVAHHRPLQRNLGNVFFQELGSGFFRGNGIVYRVENLETKAILLDAEMDDLAQIAGVDIAPGVALPCHGIVEETLEHRIFMGLDDIADPQRVDIGAVPHGEGAGGLLVHHLGETVAVHRVDVVVFLERKRVIVLVALGETYAVGGFARSDNDLADAKLHRRLDDVVGRDGIDCESGVVGVDEDARNGGEMHNRVNLGGALAGVIAVETKMHG